MEFVNKSKLFFILFLFKIVTLNAQNDALKKTYTLQKQNISVGQFLSDIEVLSGYYFSYNPQFIPEDSIIVKYTCTNKPLASILTEVLGNETTFKQINSNIILRRPPPKKKEVPPKKVTISGSIKNAKTGKKIDDVTVFQVEKKQSTVAKKGDYSLDVKTDEEYIAVSYNKKDYKDTVVVMKVSEIGQKDIVLQPLEFIDTISNQDTIIPEKIKIVEALTNESQKTQVENIPDYLDKRLSQASLVPYISTNKKMNVNSVNKYSFNLLSGYSAGLAGIELGGLLNINRKFMHGLQIGGLGNVVGGEVNGLQIGGIANNCRTLHGLQIGGFSNVTLDSSSGVQLAGFLNISRENISGIQAAGIVNLSIQEVKGIQAAGILSSAIKEVKGIQFSGILNTSLKRITGIQSAGLMNFAWNDVHGVQGASLANISRDIKGFQLSTLFNFARDVTGVQLGLVNVAKSNKGLSLGLLSFVKEGYQALEINSSDAFTADICFKTGTNYFYNIISMGAISSDEKLLHSMGYGVGTTIPIGKKKKWGVIVDTKINAITNTYIPDNDDDVKTNTLANTDFSLFYKLAPIVTFKVGTTYNVYTHHNQTAITLLHPISPNRLKEYWWGYKIGISLEL